MEGYESFDLKGPNGFIFDTQRSAADIAQENLWNGLSSLYSDNENLKKESAALTSTTRDGNSSESVAQQLDNLLDSFMNGANAVLDELTFLGNAHPALAVAIFAFHEVVKLDIARRDNNKKVLVVVLQMQSMLGPMFQLRNLDHTRMPEGQKQFHEGRLKEIVETITRDIKMCRSDITHFMSRKFVYKLILAKGYEKKFASHIETFALRRSELQSVITEYIASSISSANIAIGEVRNKIDFMDIKVDKIVSVLFRNLDTPRERDVFKFIQQNGGPEKCVNDLDLLPKLISKVGESPKTGKAAVSDQGELKELQKALSDVLKEDLDQVLEKHYSRFEKVLQVQNNNLKQMSAHLEDQGVLMQTHTTKLGKILDTVTTIMVLEEGKFRTKSVKLKDPEIQRVWNQMNLTTSSVKAKVFVLTFRDHIRVENSGLNTPLQTALFSTESDYQRSHNMQPTSSDDTEWVLEYIDVAYVQPIVEAMDEDGSGFISVKEANNFALARPKDLSLLHWIAYWAAGWHLNLIEYQKAVYAILFQMHMAIPSIHVANRTIVSDYLDKVVMRRVEALLRSVKPLPDVFKDDPKLVEVAKYVSSWQRERLKTNLNDMGFVIESPFVATTISGSARVETWIMPLLLLLLRRHLEIITLAKTIVLDPLEFDAHVTSLTSIFSVFEERMENLKAKFQQLHKDVDGQFSNFAYGLFHAAFKKSELDVSANDLQDLQIDEYVSNEELKFKTPAAFDPTILSKPQGKPFEIDEVNIYPSEASLQSPGHIPHPMEGAWYGYFSENARCIRYNRCFVFPIVDSKIVAKSESFFGESDITGSIIDDTNPFTVEFEFFPHNSEYRPQICKGTYDHATDILTGTFVWKPDDEPTVNDIGSPKIVVNGDVDSTVATSDVVEKDEGLASSLKTVNESSFENDSRSSSDFPGGERITLEAGNNGVTPGLEPVHSAPTEITNETVDISSHLDETSPSIIPGENSGAVENPSYPPSPSTIRTNEPVDPVEGPVDNDPQPKPEPDTLTFCFRRTPPHLFRFRFLLDGPGPAPCWNVWPLARKRWAFAAQAVLYETRMKMNSRRSFQDSLAERRKWLHHAIRYDLTEPSINPEWSLYDSFTDAEWDIYDDLFATVHPSLARLYEEISHYMARRETYIVGRVFCDSCRMQIAFRRHQCLVCIQEDFSDGIDLCVNCFSKSNTIRWENMIHDLSHPLLRSKYRIHNFEKGTFIPEARLNAERSKKMFRELEDAKTQEQEERHGNTMKGKGSRKSRSGQSIVKKDDGPIPAATPIVCACCGKTLSLPCWVCLSCSPLTFICDSCDSKNTPVTDIYRGHSVRMHHLVRIHDSVEVKPFRSKKGTEVEQQLEELNLHISALQGKVNTQIEDSKEIKTVIEDLVKSVGLNDYETASTVSLIDSDDDFVLEATAVDTNSHADADGDPSDGHPDVKVVDFVNANVDDRPTPKTPKTQMDLRERLNALEGKVESMNQILIALAQDDKHAAVVDKVEALEAKIDQQFGTLLSLVRNLVSASRPASDSSST